MGKELTKHTKAMQVGEQVYRYDVLVTGGKKPCKDKEGSSLAW